MASFTPSKKTASDFNNGNTYINEVDIVQADTVNNLIESALYSQEVAGTAKSSAEEAATQSEKSAEAAQKAAEAAETAVHGQFIPISDKGNANGVATLDSDGKMFYVHQLKWSARYSDFVCGVMAVFYSKDSTPITTNEQLANNMQQAGVTQISASGLFRDGEATASSGLSYTCSCYGVMRNTSNQIVFLGVDIKSVYNDNHNCVANSSPTDTVLAI